jgi:hypothetical protein
MNRFQVSAALAAALVFALVSVPDRETVVLAQSQVTPAISTVSGTVANGSLMTVVGSQLNAERRQNWDSFFTSRPNAWSFEGTDFRADGYTQPGGDPGGVYDSTVQILGNKSVKFHVASSGGTCPQANVVSSLIMGTNSLSSSEYWVRAYVRYNSIRGWPSNHIKMLYPIFANYYYNPHGGGPGLPSQMTMTYDGTSHTGNIPTGQMENNRWYAAEVHWRTSSPRIFDAYLDGVQIHAGTPNGSGQNDLSTLLFGVINACGSSAFELDHWMDGLAVASTRIYPSALVEVGDNPNYSSARRRVQAVERISDSQITFRLSTSGLGSGPYYLWVRNNTQAVSGAYLLGSGTVIPAPAAPTNVRVIR